MVAFYKHDIPSWMDGTEDLDDRPYRVYHVICQLIYLNEGPIKINERGIAGRCKTNILAFRKALAELLEKGKLTLHPDGTLTQPRAEFELTHIATNRVHASSGGKARAKALEKLKSDEAAAQRYPALRLEETRQEKKEVEPELKLGAPAPPPDLEKQFFDRAVQIITSSPKDARSAAASLRKACGMDVAKARSVLELASGKSDPATWIRGHIAYLKRKASEPSDDTVFMTNADDRYVLG
jgi:hypothetical protein